MLLQKVPLWTCLCFFLLVLSEKKKKRFFFLDAFDLYVYAHFMVHEYTYESFILNMNKFWYKVLYASLPL